MALDGVLIESCIGTNPEAAWPSSCWWPDPLTLARAIIATPPRYRDAEVLVPEPFRRLLLAPASSPASSASPGPRGPSDWLPIHPTAVLACGAIDDPDATVEQRAAAWSRLVALAEAIHWSIGYRRRTLATLLDGEYPGDHMATLGETMAKIVAGEKMGETVVAATARKSSASGFSGRKSAVADENWAVGQFSLENASGKTIFG